MQIYDKVHNLHKMQRQLLGKRWLLFCSHHLLLNAMLSTLRIPTFHDVLGPIL